MNTNNNNHGHIEVKAISCKAVKSFIAFQKPSLSLFVSVANSDDSPKHLHDPQRTPIDKDGGENPEWNQSMRFDFSPHHLDNLVLFFEIRNHAVLLGTNVVGRVRVPMAELAAEQMAGIFHFVSYQVKSQDDKPNGVLTFGYKMKDRVIPNSPSQQIYQPDHIANYFRPPEFPPPSLQTNSIYSPLEPETNSLYPALMIDASPVYPSNSLYPPLPETEPMYLPLPEMYHRPSGSGLYDYQAVAPPAWGGGGYYGPSTGEGHGGYYGPQGSGCVYPEPVEAVGCRMDGCWDRRRICWD